MSQGRIPIIGGNWKMNTVLTEAVGLAEALVEQIGDVSGVEVVVFPPSPNLVGVGRVLEGSSLQLGAQNLFWEDSGAYTGEVSGPMLRAVGCEWVIVGHSERRHILGESNQVVNRKIHAALRNGLKVILAVGETREEHHAGKAQQVVMTQLRDSLVRVEPAAMENVVVAYEPVWAIGTGETATPQQAYEMHGWVRVLLGGLFGGRVAGAVRIQYGGSVSASNAAELMAQPGIDGALVGGASLKPGEFAAIVNAAASGS